MTNTPPTRGRDSFHEDPATWTHDERFGVFPEFAQLAAEARFTVLVAGTFPLADWRKALNISCQPTFEIRRAYQDAIVPSRSTGFSSHVIWSNVRSPSQIVCPELFLPRPGELVLLGVDV
ncbi:hypothetical protein ACFYMW_09920 [Streptomyces sp. NPDC006692]|uniref:hypothetical protein n=1 Tax=Streptomyces sp. NPDC006692 TaxID=3364758 RepID=UPI00367AF877